MKPKLHPDDFPKLNRKNRRKLLKKLLDSQKKRKDNQ